MLSPFLLIGVGGSGGKTLRIIHDDLERRLRQAGWQHGLPQAWQFLHIDVPTQPDGIDPDLPGQLPSRDYAGLVAPGVDYRAIDTSLTMASGQHVVDALAGWRPDPNRVNVAIQNGAGQFRALGRAVVLASLDRVNEALQAAKRRLAGAEVTGELQRLTRQLGGRPGNDLPDPKVVVISSIAGGSGAGAVIDVCDAVQALGDRWAKQSVGILYAPDAFDYLAPQDRKGVRPNSLATLAELLNGFWSDSGPSDGTEELFAQKGVQVGAISRMGPRYPFLVGASNAKITYRTQNDIYRAMGRSLASWVSSPILIDQMNTYVQGNWSASASVPDATPFKLNGAETPFGAMGSARVGLGRDRFEDYAAERMARRLVTRVTAQHETLRRDDRPEKALVQESADAVFLAFLGASGLDERGTERNQIVDALTPVGLAAAIDTEEEAVASSVREVIPTKGWRPAEINAEIMRRLGDRREAFRRTQRAAREEAVARWSTGIQTRVTDLAGQSIARYGAVVTVELLRRLRTEIEQVKDELTAEAGERSHWEASVSSYVLNDLGSSTAVILASTGSLQVAIGRAVQALGWEQERLIREEAVALLPDLAENFLAPLIDAVRRAHEGLAGTTGSGSIIAQWPVGEEIPERLRPAANEFLLESVETYPQVFDQLIRRSTTQDTQGAANDQAEHEALLGVDSTGDDQQHLLVIGTKWSPGGRTDTTAAPARAIFTLAVDAEGIIVRARDWVRRDGSAIGQYVAEGFREYLASAVEPLELQRRLDLFRGSLISALDTAAPLVDVNASMLMLVHQKRQLEYGLTFSEVPLPDKSVARALFREVLESKEQWDERVQSSFSDAGGAFIDIFAVTREPYQPVVFNSLMRPVGQQWGSVAATADQRVLFWRWRRARPLAEALPFSPEIVHAIVRGWFVAGSMSQVEWAADDAVSLVIPDPRSGAFGRAAFPYPTLTPLHNRSDAIAILLETASLAMVQANAAESLEPLRPYSRLKELGGPGDGTLAREFERWLTAADAPAGRADAVVERLTQIRASFDDLFRKVELQHRLEAVPPSFELRGHILSALDELLTTVGRVEDASTSTIWN